MDECTWYSKPFHRFMGCTGVFHFDQSNGICPDCGKPIRYGDGSNDTPRVRQPDQADDLRRFVAEQSVRAGVVHSFERNMEAMERLMIDDAPSVLVFHDVGEAQTFAAELLRTDRLTSLPPETAEVYRAKLARPTVGGHNVMAWVDDLITYRRLWLDLKAELEAEATSWSHPDKEDRLSSQFSPKRARQMLDRVLQMETLAFYAHVPPATGETWEAVREGLRVKG